MKSSTAAEMKLKEAIDRMDQRIERIESIMSHSMQKIGDHIFREELKDKFGQDEKIEHFEWTYERIYKPRECFVSGKKLGFGTKAYKGINVLSPLSPPKEIENTIYPLVVWLCKEEFTMRRIKGQI